MDPHRPDVEFLSADPAAGEDEAWPAAPARDRRPLAIGALILVGSALVARAVTDRSTTPKATPAPAARTTGDTSLPVPPFPIPTPPQNLRDCPLAGDGQSSCVSTRRVPKQTLVAVREAFPSATSTYALDERVRDTGLGGGAIWFRELRLKRGAQRITVQLHRKISDDIDSQIVNDDGRQSSLTLNHPLGPLQLIITIVAPSGTPIDPSPAVPLSNDRRLIALR